MTRHKQIVAAGLNRRGIFFRKITDGEIRVIAGDNFFPFLTYSGNADAKIGDRARK